MIRSATDLEVLIPLSLIALVSSPPLTTFTSLIFLEIIFLDFNKSISINSSLNFSKSLN